MFKNLARAVVVAVAGLGAAGALFAAPAMASTANVPPPVPITLPVHHPGLIRPGLPGLGLGSCGIGSCGTGIGIGSCGIGIGGCGGIGAGGCSSCGLGGGFGLGSPIYVGQDPWYGISSSSLCNLGCGGVGISTLPSVVYVNGLTGVCAYSAGGLPIPSLYGIGGYGLRNRLGLR